jgi:hypothetical protein
MPTDLFIKTLRELHSEAPIDLLKSLRAQLEQKKLNPGSADTAAACLAELASDQSSLLHVLTAAYLINGGVMIKDETLDENFESFENFGDEMDAKDERDSKDEKDDFDSLEAELNSFSMT